MPVKRRIHKARPHRITPEAIDAYRAGDHLALHRALSLRPWQPSPLDADEDEAPWPPGSVGAASWPQSRELRAELGAGDQAIAPSTMGR
jgi:hypothetical protein